LPEPFVRQIVLTALDTDLIAAVTSASPTWQCLMCQSSSHLFNDCPKILDLDSLTWRVVFTSLLKACGTTHSQVWPSSTLRPLCMPGIHAVSLHNTPTPFDEVAHDTVKLVDDPDVIDQVDSHPDFQ